jgi:hypothetical protein
MSKKIKINIRNWTHQQRIEWRNQSEKESIASWQKLDLSLQTQFGTHWLAGFWEGEGSITVSVKKHPTSTFGFNFQPEISISQHASGIHLLWWTKRYVFNNTGSMTWKNGSDATWVYKFTDKKQISETFEPWYETHVYPFLGTEGIKHWEKFKECRNLISNRKNWNLDDAQACAKQIYTLTSYKGRDRKLSLEQLQLLIQEHPNQNTKKRSSSSIKSK